MIYFFLRRYCYFTKVSFISLLFTLIHIGTNAQNPQEEVNIIKPNLKYIEHLIKLRVDSIRLLNQVNPLVNDSILYLSCRSHARYLTKELSLSHYREGSKNKRTYHERAVKLGAEDYYVSENLAQVDAFSKVDEVVRPFTYTQIADKVIDTWIKSMGCMANILSPSHVIVGIASWYEPARGEIRIATSFASVASGYKAKHYPWLFPYAQAVDMLSFKNSSVEKPARKYQWGIGPKPDSKVQESYRRIRKLINSIGLIQENDSVFVVFSNPRGMMKLFEASDDGLAIELISKKTYVCNQKYIEPIRREEEFTVKGEILQPIYREVLLNDIEGAKRKPKLLVKHIGNIPKKYKTDDYILNLVVLKNKRIVDIVTFNQAPSKIFDFALTLPPAQDSLPQPDYYIPHLRRDTLKLRIYFDQNKADVMQKFGDSISSWVENKDIQRAAVYSYASIEGTEEINKDLAEKRANEVITFFETRDGRRTPMVKVTQENWFQFFKDIKNSRHQFLTSIDSAHVRNYVNQKLNSRELEPILARHRYTDLKILAYKIVNDVSIDGLAIEEYNNLFETLKLVCSKDSTNCNGSLPMIKRFELVQLFLFQRNVDKKVNWNLINQLPLSLYSGDYDIHSEPLAKLYYNKLRFRLSHYGETFSRADSLYTLKELNRFPDPDPVIAYNYLLLMLNSRSPDDPEPFYRQNVLNELASLITIIENSGFDASTVERLKLYYHFKAAEQEYFMNRLGDFNADVKNSLDYILNHFKTYPPQQSEANNIAMFFSAFRKYDEAMAIIEPFAFSSKPSKESLELYLKFFYTNPRVKQNTDFYQLLKDAADILSPEEWCKLFKGDWPINFQVLDHEPLRYMFCKMCNE